MKPYIIQFTGKKNSLPFAVKENNKIDKKLREVGASWKSLERFMKILEKQFKENIYSMGFDVINNKCYERFMFEKNGFLEIVMSNKPKIEAAFLNEKKAIRFKKALDKTIKYFNKRG